MYIWNFYERSGQKLQMVRMPTICLEMAFKGKNEIISPKPLKSANDGKLTIHAEPKTKNEHLFLGKESSNCLTSLSISEIPI